MGAPTINLVGLPPAILLDAEGEQHIEAPPGDSHYCFTQQRGTAQFVFHLRYPGQRVTVRGLVTPAEGGLAELQTQMLHHSPNTYANTLVKTLGTTASTSRYRGLIRINEGCSNSESYLSHHSLLLHPQAFSWTVPSLEILNDQVKCSHAATIRTINEQELFYPRSRGLSKDEAKEMIIRAFVADVS